MIWFKLIFLRSIAKQVIPTYINPLIPDGIHLFFWTRFERREKPDLSLHAERQAKWFHSKREATYLLSPSVPGHEGHK